jgi:hypothetical protein
MGSSSSSTITTIASSCYNGKQGKVVNFLSLKSYLLSRIICLVSLFFPILAVAAAVALFFTHSAQ